jgi:hypothetical protein
MQEGAELVERQVARALGPSLPTMG